MIERDTTLCPVCGFDLGEPAWPNGLGSFEICSCCGIQFGYEDCAGGGGPAARAELYATRRERWIGDGKKWWSPRPRPSDYDPDAQLARLAHARTMDEPWPLSDGRMEQQLPAKAAPYTLEVTIR